MVDPRAVKAAFVFPGQGSQAVGMGRAWSEAYPEAQNVFAEADEALGSPLSRLCWVGPEEKLQLTANTQPAILTVSIAILRSVASELPGPLLLAGHSLGEYSAHVAAGTVRFSDALRLVRRRGELMQEAVPVGEGAMAAVLGLAAEQVAEIAAIAADQQVCSVANFNAPGQTVIAGHREAVERATTLAKERGARRALRLPVSAPFHSSLMQPAREALTPQLEAAEFADPVVPVVCNIDAVPVSSGSTARDALIRQVDGPVRWVESVQWMAAEGGVGIFVEIGPGNVLTGLIRRIAPHTKAFSLAEPADLDKLRQRIEDAA